MAEAMVKQFPVPVQNSQEEVLHYFMVVVSVAVGQKTGCKHDDGVDSVTIVALIKTQGKEREIK